MVDRLSLRVCLTKPLSTQIITLNTFHAYTEAGIPIVGCEPSCTSALTDDYVELVNTPKAKRVAENTFALEEFLLKAQENSELPLTYRTEPRDILLHGHCHQRALSGIQPIQQMLELPPTHNVTVIDSSCCGMAGSFGYEKSHYELSMNIGELRLFPTIRDQEGEFTLTASGFSCRHQLEHGTGIGPKHPIEVLSEAISANNNIMRK